MDLRRRPLVLALSTVLLGTAAYADGPKLGQELIPATEAAATERANGITRSFMEERYGKKPAGEAKRGVHPIAHGCVRATVNVKAGLPTWLREGLFKEPKEYRAWIRFSNASSRPKPDRDGDSRGFALKVMGVGGERILPEDRGGQTIDFTMNSFPVFFAKDAAAYADFVDSFMLKKSFTPYLFPSVDPLSWRLKELKIIHGIGSVKVSSVLNANFYSIVPARHGPSESVAVKYSLKPCGGVKEKAIDQTDDRYLKKALISELKSGDACFEFGVQKQIDPVKMPIEDATELWDEKLSPFIPVATIHIPAQSFDTDEQNRFCENLVFNPWRNLPAHFPLGGINRMRLSNYQMSEGIRQGLNRVNEAEPE